MEYKITSIYPQAYIEAMNELICMDIEFVYKPYDKAIFAELKDDAIKAFENLQVIVERNEPTQAEVDELNEELYDLLDKIKDGYIELSESIYARAEEDCIDYSTRIMMVDVDAVTIDNYSLVFNFGSDYISAGYFSKADQIKVYEQAIKDVKNYLDDGR